MRFSTSTGKERLIVLEGRYIYIREQDCRKEFPLCRKKRKISRTETGNFSRGRGWESGGQVELSSWTFGSGGRSFVIFLLRNFPLPNFSRTLNFPLILIHVKKYTNERWYTYFRYVCPATMFKYFRASWEICHQNRIGLCQDVKRFISQRRHKKRMKTLQRLDKYKETKVGVSFLRDKNDTRLT